jgi:hypothetical protein
LENIESRQNQLNIYKNEYFRAVLYVNSQLILPGTIIFMVIFIFILQKCFLFPKILKLFKKYMIYIFFPQLISTYLSLWKEKDGQQLSTK